ncbi:MAG: fatty acid desaturase [Ponticaulis sp.]|nr:fatty acid desaturase [Ponticaulis sp.]
METPQKLRPTKLFTATDWAKICKRSDLLGLGMIAHAWGIIALSMAMVALWPNPLTVLLAVMLIGARQLGLAILMHEAAHGGLSTSLKVNDWVGQWLCAAPVGAHLKNYRDYHLSHHKWAQTEKDPDLILSAPFPITRTSLRRKISRDLTGQTFLKQRTNQFANALGLGIRKAKGRNNRAQTAREAVIPFLFTNLILLVVLTLLIGWWAYPVLWLLPLATWNQLVTRLRNIAEHACLDGSNHPMRVARTTRTNFLERLFIAPYWVAYHCEHHMFMHIPCYRLAEAHRLLSRDGTVEQMEVEAGYWRVLKQASSRQAVTPA